MKALTLFITLGAALTAVSGPLMAEGNPFIPKAAPPPPPPKPVEEVPPPKPPEVVLGKFIGVVNGSRIYLNLEKKVYIFQEPSLEEDTHDLPKKAR